MRKIGFHGGSSLCELGSMADMILFFKCLDAFVVKTNPDCDWSLLTDRLYRRYLRLEELNAASELMARVKEIFSSVPTSAVDWGEMRKNPSLTCLDSSRKTLSEVFESYFSGFDYCVESSRLNFEGFKDYPGYKYEPVKTVITDLPGFYRDQKKSLAEYDALEGQPFWQQ